MMCDGRSSFDIMYQQCFDQLDDEDKARLQPDAPIAGFFNEVIHPIGKFDFTVTLDDGIHSRSEVCTFHVIPATSSYDILLGRQGLANFNSTASTPHQTMGFPTPTGIAYIRGNQECLMTTHPADGTTALPPNPPTDENWVLNPAFPEQTITLGRTLSPQVKTHLKQLLVANKDIFAWQSSDMIGVPRHIAEHRLNAYKDARPVAQKKRPLGPDRVKAMNEQVNDLLEAGIIRKCNHQTWVANPVMVLKKNGSWRMCVDYKDLNKACPKDQYPLPGIDLKVDSLAPFKYKFFLDAYRGYHQIQMAYEDDDRTAFRTDRGVYCYTKMPFGLKNAGATYQRLMDQAFINQIGVNLEVYVDDLVIKSTQEDTMLMDIQHTFEQLRDINIKLNPGCAPSEPKKGNF